MIGQTISHYHILEKLGEGGMGVVYKAQDAKLNRTVALKFLPQHLSASEQDKARFIQEAQAAAALNHPNICTIHGIEEHDGQTFIVMEFIEGQTLRDKGANVPLKQTIEIGIQLAEGLAVAHEKGIVHRDLKPENIMLQKDGRVRVMDFGLAKLKGASRLTKAGSTVGTTGYMSPEQVQGLEIDHRTDIFSLGVILYELFAGQSPFKGVHETAINYEIVNVDPEPMLSVKPEISPELDAIVLECMAKEPSERSQSAAEVAKDLRRVKRESSKTRMSRVTTATSRVSSTPEQPARKVSFGLAKLLSALLSVVLVAAAVGAYVLFFAKPEQTFDSVAVMPLVNVGGDPNTDYLSDGITEAIINNLSRLRNLRVMSRSSVFRFKGQEIDPLEVGKVFNVQAVLTGRIVRRESDFQLSVELVDARDGKQLWGEQYNRPFSTIQALQGELSKDISEQLRVQITGEERASLSVAPTNNPEAYQLYLRGRLNWNRRSADALQRAAELYKQAIEIDPTYAQAYTGFAETYALIPLFVFPPPMDALDKAKSYAQKALQINPQQAEAYTALAWTKFIECDLEGAERDFRRAIELNPNYPTAHHWYGVYLGHGGRVEEALQQHMIAQKLDPLSLVIQTTLANNLYLSNRPAEAIRELRKVLDVEPNFGLALCMLGTVFHKIGIPDSAAVTLEKATVVFGKGALPILGSFYAMTGKKERAREILRELEQLASQGYKVENAIALVYMGFEDKEKTLLWLERTYNNRAAWPLYLGYMKNHPGLKSMWSDARIPQALKKLGVEMDWKE
jgi:serine/threonine protein kinase/Flp pilus assembly protein TadD